MIDLCDSILIFWDGKSKGAKYTSDYAKKAGKHIKIISNIFIK